MKATLFVATRLDHNNKVEVCFFANKQEADEATIGAGYSVTENTFEFDDNGNLTQVAGPLPGLDDFDTWETDDDDGGDYEDTEDPEPE